MTTPDQVSGLQLWLKADAITGLSDTSLVSQWDDSSGLANHATQPSSLVQPLYRTGIVNGLPVVRFDGVGSRLTLGTAGFKAITNNATGISVFCYVNLTTAGGSVTRQILGISEGVAGNTPRMKFGQRFSTFDRWAVSGRRLDADTQQNVLGNATQSGFQRITTIVDWANSNADVYRNGASEASTTAWFVDGNTSATDAINSHVGAKDDGTGEWWLGDIAELFVYNRAVSTSEQAALESYLLQKYEAGPVVDRRPFVGPVPRLMRTGILAPLQLSGDRQVSAPTGLNGTASLTATATITAAGTVQGAASLTETATISAAGVGQGTASLTETATITAAGNMSAASTAAATVTATITAAGVLAGTADPYQAPLQLPAFFIWPSRASIQLSGDQTVSAGALALTAVETAWDTATDPKTATITGCQTGDYLFVISGSGQFGGAAVTAVTTSTTAGSTGSWTEPQEALNTGDAKSWVSSAVAQVTANGDVTVQVSRTTSSTGFWGFSVVRARNSAGLGTSGFVNTSATQVVNLTVQGNSAVFFSSFDWDAGSVGTGWTPTTDVTLIERSNGNYTVHAAYWENQTAGTRDYGSTGAGGANRKTVGLEILSTSAVLNFNGTASLTTTATITAAGTAQGTASLTETATITVSAGGNVVGTAALTETATITAVGTGQGTAAVTETATITAAGSANYTGTAALTETATITTNGQPTGAATLTATATITAAGQVGNTASRTTTATITASGTAQGTASLTETFVVTASASGNITGTASLTETATITAVGNLAATGTATSTTTATITATGTVTGTSTRTTTATITANGQPQATISRITTATITSTGNLAATGTATIAATATITATGALATGGTATRTITVVITANGALVVLGDGHITGGRRTTADIAGGRRAGVDIYGGQRAGVELTGGPR